MRIDFYLEQTLLKMLEKKSIDEIFVVDIIKNTGTCKGTFYKYYCDKFECHVSCFKRFIYKDLDKCATWSEFLTALLTVYSKNSAVIINSFVPESGVNSVRNYNDQFIREMYLKLCADGKATPRQMRLINTYASEITRTACGWLAAGHIESVALLVEFLQNLLPVGLSQSGGVDILNCLILRRQFKRNNVSYDISMKGASRKRSNLVILSKPWGLFLTRLFDDAKVPTA